MINPIGPVPTPLDSAADFNTKAFGLLAQLPGFVTETNATADTIQINADILAAVLLAMAFPEYTGTSASSVTVGTGPKVFATQTGKLWAVGQIVVVSNGANVMRGPVTGYSAGNLTVNVTSAVGGGTFSSWTIGLSFDGLLLAKSGANADITSLSGLTTPLSAAQGGTGSSAGAVVLSGAQTVAGVKTLSSAPILSAGATFGNASMANPSGSAPLHAARAWCVFNGTLTGTNAPINGGNVTSVTRNAAGDYTVNFATAMPDANYAVLVTSGDNVPGVGFGVSGFISGTAAAVRVSTQNNAAGGRDVSAVHVVVFR